MPWHIQHSSTSRDQLCLNCPLWPKLSRSQESYLYLTFVRRTDTMGDGIPSDNLYLQNLPADMTEDTLSQIFGAIGYRVVRSKIMPPTNPAVSTCAAMVQFATWLKWMQTASTTTPMNDICGAFTGVPPSSHPLCRRKRHVLFSVLQRL